jgi:uncharacterized cupin superfamily protein
MTPARTSTACRSTRCGIRVSAKAPVPRSGAHDGAHQIVNGTDSPIRVLMLSSMIGPDIVGYLDTGKVYATSPGGEPIMLARPGPTVEYWEGEE